SCPLPERHPHSATSSHFVAGCRLSRSEQ
ncbi:hypothetical protein CCACVL1_01699, partial [Corchorus capsularis]